MSDSTAVVWDDALTDYDLGPAHPLRPVRLALTMALTRELGLLDHVRVVAPERAGDDVLELVHDPLYVATVKQADDATMARLVRHGLGPGDTPAFDRMHEAASLITGASVVAAREVWEGRSQHAVSISGGLHHAMRDRASGFCVYDDPAVAIAWLLAQGCRRVAYVDIDVHHGDGVQAAFYDDPRVLTVSVHESGRTLFPGTGWPEETGVGAGVGTSANLALPAGTDDAGWLRAFDAVVPQLLRSFGPEVLVTQLGCDTHAWDPLAHLELTLDGQRAAHRRLHDLAHRVAGGRWVALGGGGYDAVGVVPRSWTGVIAEAAAVELPDEIPVEWQLQAAELGRARAPRRMSDLAPGEVLDDGLVGVLPSAVAASVRETTEALERAAQAAARGG